METNPNLASNRSVRPVMDIQPRRPIQPVARPAVPVTRASYGTPSASVSVPVAPSPAVTTPVRPAPPRPAEPVSESPAKKPVADKNAEEKSLPKPAKDKAPIGAIVSAVLVGAALIGLTVFAFMKDQQADNTNANENPAASQTSVMPEEVDESIQAIEEELDTLDDSQDFSENALSDETLGL